MSDAEAKEAEEDRKKQALIRERLKQKKLELQGKTTKVVVEEKKQKLKIPKGDMDFLALSKVSKGNKGGGLVAATAYISYVYFCFFYFLLFLIMSFYYSVK